MNQLYPIPLRSLAWSASGRDVIDLSVLVPTQGGSIVNVEAITFDVDVTPTLSAGTLSETEANLIVTGLTIKDGVRTLFDGSFTSLRLFEMLERGKLFTPDNDLLATTERGGFARSWYAAPRMVSSPDDFRSPAATFKGGRITVQYSTLTGPDAALTALTATIQPIAWCSLTEDVNLPPELERYEVLQANGTPLTGDALYMFVGMAKSSFAAIAAGDFANVTILANGLTCEAIASAAFTRAFYESMKSGHVTELAGEPRAATDDNAKIVQGTAVAATSALMTPVIWTPPNGKLTKLVFEAKPSLTLKWSGSQGSSYILASRLIPRQPGDAAKYGALIQAALGGKLDAPRVPTKGGRPADLSARPYMPLRFKVQGA